MSNPNKLTTNKNTLTKRVVGAMGGLSLLAGAAGFLAGDKMHSEAPVSQNNDPTPTEVSTLAPTPEETLEKAGIRIVDDEKTPTPTFITYTGPTEAAETTETATETLPPIVFTGGEQTEIAPSPTATADTKAKVMTPIVFTNEQEAVPTATIENQSPTIAPVTTEIAPADANDTTFYEAVTPIESGDTTEQGVIGPEGEEVEDTSEPGIETITVQVQPGESVSQVLTEILGQAGYAIAPEQVDAIARELMAGAANGSGDVFDGPIVLRYDAESDSYKVVYEGEASLTPHAAEVIENELPTEQP